MVLNPGFFLQLKNAHCLVLAKWVREYAFCQSVPTSIIFTSFFHIQGQQIILLALMCPSQTKKKKKRNEIHFPTDLTDLFQGFYMLNTMLNILNTINKIYIHM